MAQSQRRNIEIFSAGCPVCREAINIVRRVAGASHDIEIHDMHQAHIATCAKQHGVRSLPAIMIDGALFGCSARRGADEATLRQKLS